jgi:hypothetical protein
MQFSDRDNREDKAGFDESATRIRRIIDNEVRDFFFDCEVTSHSVTDLFGYSKQ